MRISALVSLALSAETFICLLQNGRRIPVPLFLSQHFFHPLPVRHRLVLGDEQTEKVGRWKQPTVYTKQNNKNKNTPEDRQKLLFSSKNDSRR